MIGICGGICLSDRKRQRSWDENGDGVDGGGLNLWKRGVCVCAGLLRLLRTNLCEVLASAKVQAWLLSVRRYSTVLYRGRRRARPHCGEDFRPRCWSTLAEGFEPTHLAGKPAWARARRGKTTEKEKRTKKEET